MNLEQQVDLPIRDAVAMLNLLGCETVWSCCGFNYKEIVPKSHIIGAIQIHVKANTHAFDILNEVLDNESILMHGWFCILRKFPQQGNFFSLQNNMVLTKDPNHPFENPSSLHFHEQGNMKICVFVKRLAEFQSKFRAKATVFDQNDFMRSQSPFWQIEPSEPWEINRNEIIAHLPQWGVGKEEKSIIRLFGGGAN